MLKSAHQDSHHAALPRQFAPRALLKTKRSFRASWQPVVRSTIEVLPGMSFHPICALSPPYILTVPAPKTGIATAGGTGTLAHAVPIAAPVFSHDLLPQHCCAKHRQHLYYDTGDIQCKWRLEMLQELTQHSLCRLEPNKVLRKDQRLEQALKYLLVSAGNVRLAAA